MKQSSEQITIFEAKKIITMNAEAPEATHVAVRDGKILAVGTLEEAALWGEGAIDTQFSDKFLLPGLVEAHCHLMEGAMWEAHYVGYYDRRGPDGKLWNGLKSLDAVIHRLSLINQTMEGTDVAVPLLAWGFDPIFFGSQRLSVTDLARVQGTSRPIAILHASAHLMNVNSEMLARAGIDANTDIDGIDRDSSGQPTGELQEFPAMFPIYQIIGKRLAIEAAENPSAIWNFGRVAQIAGVTTATDLVNDLSPEGATTLREVVSDENYPIRIVPALAPQRASGEALDRLLEVVKNNTDKLRYGPVKFIVDGSIQGFTARLMWPGYFNGRENGLWLIPPSQFARTFEPFHKAGLQLHIHTNGDEATELVLDALQELLTKYPHPDHRHTLQHCQMASPAQLARAAALGVCVNFFANHIYYWGDAHYSQTMGPDRANRMNPIGTAHRLGIHYAFHSDAPITQLNPLFTAWCAVQRETASGRVLGAENRISVKDALRAITLGAAWTLRMDDVIGSIEVGKFADFTVLESDPMDVQPSALKDIKVWGTVLAGRPQRAPQSNG